MVEERPQALANHLYVFYKKMSKLNVNSLNLKMKEAIYNKKNKHRIFIVTEWKVVFVGYKVSCISIWIYLFIEEYTLIIDYSVWIVPRLKLL